MYILMHNGNKLGYYHTKRTAENNKYRWENMCDDDSYEIVTSNSPKNNDSPGSY